MNNFFLFCPEQQLKLDERFVRKVSFIFRSFQNDDEDDEEEKAERKVFFSSDSNEQRGMQNFLTEDKRMND